MTAPAMRRFEGKAAVVTGGASGIGAATARRLASEGAAVLIADINAAGAARVVEEIAAAGGRAVACETDVADPARIEAMVARAVEAFGRLDVLHNNATLLEAGPIDKISVEGWNRTLAVNLTAPFLGIRAALPIMRRGGGGAIVNTASISGLAGDYGLAAYNAAKAGVINLTKNAAIELARHRIRVNCVCPGGIATPLLGSLLGDNAPVPHWIHRPGPAADDDARRRYRERLEQAHPLGRLGTADEIAAAVCFLASDDASFITGAALVADGGLTSHTGIPAPGR